MSTQLFFIYFNNSRESPIVEITYPAGEKYNYLMPSLGSGEQINYEYTNILKSISNIERRNKRLGKLVQGIKKLEGIQSLGKMN